MKKVLLACCVFLVLAFAILGSDTLPVIPESAPLQLASVATPAPDVAGTPALPQNTYAVVKVIDGDTISIIKDGETVTLRLIGLDTPETVDPRKPVQCFGKVASDKAEELLTGKMVRLEFDASQGTLDKYGRTLAYVFLPAHADVPAEIFFNEYMIAEGYGHEYTYNLSYKYRKEFKEAQRRAREEKRGLWADDTCAGDTKVPATS